MIHLENIFGYLGQHAFFDYLRGTFMNWKSSLLIGMITLLLVACSSLKGSNLDNSKSTASGSMVAPESNTITENTTAFDEFKKRSIYFDFDSAIIRTADQLIVSDYANYLKSQPQIKTRLQGNTDLRGSREYNLALGQRRAESVKQALILLGINPDQLEAVSFGMEQLRALGNTEADHAQNRRVDIAY